MRGERRPRGAFPARMFEREKVLDPARQVRVPGFAFDLHFAQLGQAGELAAQLLALLARKAGFKIGLG